jgi:hypothetical protein
MYWPQHGRLTIHLSDPSSWQIGHNMTLLVPRDNSHKTHLDFPSLMRYDPHEHRDEAYNSFILFMKMVNRGSVVSMVIGISSSWYTAMPSFSWTRSESTVITSERNDSVSDSASKMMPVSMHNSSSASTHLKNKRNSFVTFLKMIISFLDAMRFAASKRAFVSATMTCVGMMTVDMMFLF